MAQHFQGAGASSNRNNRTAGMTARERIQELKRIGDEVADCLARPVTADLSAGVVTVITDANDVCTDLSQTAQEAVDAGDMTMFQEIMDAIDAHRDLEKKVGEWQANALLSTLNKTPPPANKPPPPTVPYPDQGNSGSGQGGATPTPQPKEQTTPQPGGGSNMSNQGSRPASPKKSFSKQGSSSDGLGTFFIHSFTFKNRECVSIFKFSVANLNF